MNSFSLRSFLIYLNSIKMKTDETYISRLSEFPGAHLFAEAKQTLDRDPESAFVAPGCVFVKTNGEDWIPPEFELSVLPENLDPAHLKAGESRIQDVRKEYEVKRHKPRYTRAYSYAAHGKFKILVPDHGCLYVIQENERISPGEAFIQQVGHHHTPDMERILDNAGYAIFKSIDFPFYPVGALISGSEMVIMGGHLRASMGHYREISGPSA